MAVVPWPLDSKILEFGAERPLGDLLRAVGCANYLAVLRSEAEVARVAFHVGRPGVMHRVGVEVRSRRRRVGGAARHPSLQHHGDL